MGFKVGDKVKCIKIDGSFDRDLTLGKIYIVDTGCHMAMDNWICIKNDDGGKHNGFNLKWYGFELVNKDQPKTELEWLDRIQSNFKE